MNNVIITEKKFGRPTKEEKYEQERINILNEIYNYLGIKDGNKVFYIEDIESDKKNI